MGILSDFISERDKPTNRVRCPIHGFIHYSENERQIIDHPLFRRLRYIRQLALTEFVYPGANHTRFEHSLGVMDLASRGFDTLAAKRRGLMKSVLCKVPGFEDRPLAKARQLVRLASLLHDTGHASFSHAAENVVNGGVGHVALSKLIVSEKDYLGGKLDEVFWAGCGQQIADLLEAGRDYPPQLQILHDLVSGQMDADRTDYLIRDSHHCGVEYGRFDYRRMMESLELVENPLGGLEIALNRDGIHTFEALILARYQMNAQVYYHRLRSIYDYYLIEYHRSLGDGVADTPEKVLRQNDVTMMNQIMWDAEYAEGTRRAIAARIASRNHHRAVHETAIGANALDMKRSNEVCEALKQRYQDREFIWDVATAAIHSLLRRDDLDATGLVDMPLVSNGKQIGRVGFDSQILSKIPASFQCARIYCNVNHDEKKLREEIEAFAVNVWKERGGQ